MIHLEIDKRYRKPRLASLLTRTVEAALADQKANPKSEITLKLTGDKQLQELNKRFLGEDRATDVLSFPAGAQGAYLGDIAISLPRARSQAKAGKHALEQELQLLAVHGMLHLLGHDHSTAKDKAAMWAAQQRILAKLGVNIDITASDQPH
jgi:probable rRNA maturation factor